MTRLVADASIIAKLFFDEPKSAAATKAVAAAEELLAPELIWAELASVVWKRHRRGEITAEQAGGICGEMLRTPIEDFPLRPLTPLAMELAIETDRSIYDCLYVALAAEQQCQFLTADERLVNALGKTPAGECVQMLGGR